MDKKTTTQKIKVNLLFGADVLTSTWQLKTFSDEMAALQFIRGHRNQIYGINDSIENVSALTHFEILDLIRK